MHKNKAILTIFSILLSVVLLAGCAGNNTATDNANTATGVVSTVMVTDTIDTTGPLSADKLIDLKWGTSGVVEKVNIKVGDKVKLNDVLTSLRLDSVSSDVATGQSDLATAQRDLQDILDSNTSLAQAQLDVLNAQKALETAQNTFDGLDYPRATQTLINSTQAKIWAQQDTVALAAKAYKQVQNRPDGDSIKASALLNLTNAQMTLNTLVELYNWYTGKPTPEDYAQAKAQLDLARAALDDAKRNRDNVKSGADPLKVSAARAKVTAAQATVNAMYIIAPFDGEVLSVQAGVGNSVASGDSAVELVDRQTLKVETLVDETNISSIVVGNPAKITFDSLPNVALTGKVAGINRIGQTVNGLVKYTVVVSVDPTDKPVLFGATANVTITTGAPHAMLAVPISSVGTGTGSEYVILVAADGSTRRIPVVSGDLIGNVVTVTLATPGSLKAGDQVELGIATSSSSSSGGGGGGGFAGPGG